MILFGDKVFMEIINIAEKEESLIYLILSISLFLPPPSVSFLSFLFFFKTESHVA